MSSDPETVEVALFPIPDVVAFPGMVLPLHVFEPRYRQLVHDCVQDDRLVAVSHTQKTPVNIDYSEIPVSGGGGLLRPLK